MRTRRSPRNQDRLFKVLFKPPTFSVEPVVTPCCANCINYPDTGRSRGFCTVAGAKVMAISVWPCYAAKSCHQQDSP